MVKLSRRAALAGLATAPLTPAQAQPVDFPDRPLRLVVGFPPGGPNDLLARVIAPGVGERLKRAVVVENRAGANGEIAAASVAKAAPDGGIFMLGSNGSTTVAPALSRNVPYDVRTDFAAVAPVGINPMLLVVRNDLPAANVGELLALARARPGSLNGASAGAGGRLVRRPPRAASSAAQNSVAVANRCCGSRAMARCTTCSSAAGTLGVSARTLGDSPWTCCTAMATGVSPVYGGRPVNIS